MGERERVLSWQSAVDGQNLDSGEKKEKLGQALMG